MQFGRALGQIQEIQHGIRQVNDRIDLTWEVIGRIDQQGREVNRRIDRVFLTMITIGAAQIGSSMITFVERK